MGKLLKTEKALQIMPFQFSTIEQSFSVTLEGLKNYESGASGKMQFNGYLLTADVANPVETEKVVQANYKGKNVPLHWSHDTDRRKHFFTIDSLLRDDNETGELLISWNGKSLDVDKKGAEKVEVPALNVFKILDARVIQEPEQHIEIQFSDPLQKSQDLTGLLTLSDGTDLRLTTELNTIKAWPA